MTLFILFTPCRIINLFRHFGGTCWLFQIISGSICTTFTRILKRLRWGIRFIRNVGTSSLSYKVYSARRRSFQHLLRLVTGLSSWRPWFDPRPFHLRLCVDKVRPVRVPLRILRFPLTVSLNQSSILIFHS